ncbi:MAG TPA: SRPBCC family protein [Acidimicrobiia bacterium]
MEIDALEKASLITRSVDTVERDGKPAKILTAGRTYPTSVDDLWDAVTNAERIPRWFLPVTGDLRPGGRYQLEGNAGGEVLSCDPPRRFEITWEYGGETSWVAVELSGDPGGDEAELQLRHLAHVPEDFWDQYGPGAVGIGWDLALVGLDLHVASGEALDPEEVRGWESSPNARDFIARSSAAWRDASVAGGTDPEAADASAERVTGFYLGT